MEYSFSMLFESYQNKDGTFNLSVDVDDVSLLIHQIDQDYNNIASQYIQQHVIDTKCTEDEIKRLNISSDGEIRNYTQLKYIMDKYGVDGEDITFAIQQLFLNTLMTGSIDDHFSLDDFGVDSQGVGYELESITQEIEYESERKSNSYMHLSGENLRVTTFLETKRDAIVYLNDYRENTSIFDINRISKFEILKNKIENSPTYPIMISEEYIKSDEDSESTKVKGIGYYQLEKFHIWYIDDTYHNGLRLLFDDGEYEIFRSQLKDKSKYIKIG